MEWRGTPWRTSCRRIPACAAPRSPPALSTTPIRTSSRDRASIPQFDVRAATNATTAGNVIYEFTNLRIYELAIRKFVNPYIRKFQLSVQSLPNPALDVGHDVLLADVVEK